MDNNFPISYNIGNDTRNPTQFEDTSRMESETEKVLRIVQTFIKSVEPDLLGNEILHNYHFKKN